MPTTPRPITSRDPVPVAVQPSRKGTRPDLEDVTGNPGHRGVNPDAPGGSINRGPNSPPGAKEREIAGRTVPIGSINMPPDIEPPERAAGYEAGQPAQGGGGSAASINEPPGSALGANMPPAEGEDDPPDLLDIDPDVATIGDADLTLTCTGESFTANSKIVFNGGEEPTTFVNDTTLTTIVKPSTAGTAGEYPVLVRDAAGDSEPLMFEFVEPARAATIKSRPKKPARAPKPKKKRK